MGQLTSAMIKKLSRFRQDTIDALTSDLNAGADIDAVSASGACSLSRRITQLTISATKAYILAAPTAAGQSKIVRCVAATSTPIGTLTVASPDDTAGFVCAATFVFDTAGQEIEFEATAALKWRCVRKKRAGGVANNVVPGTTVLTGYSMWQVYALSVDGTKAGATVYGLPNGSVVGERCQIICTTATNTPIGSLDGTYKGALAAAYTHLGAIGVVASTTVTGDMALLEWDGSAWTVMYQTGCTLS